MTRTAHWIMFGVALAAVVSGLGYAACKYLAEASDPFASYNHPAQPWMLATHLWVTPLLLFMLGISFAAHLIPAWRANAPGRGLGLCSFALAITMVISSAALSAGSEGTARAAIAWIHGVSGSLFLIASLSHAAVMRRVAKGKTVRTAHLTAVKRAAGGG